jgi:hypothetical protein
MRTLQTQEIAAATGGCFLGGDGEYYDMKPDGTGSYYPVPCVHAVGTPPGMQLPKPRDPICPIEGDLSDSGTQSKSNSFYPSDRDGVASMW